MHAQTTFASVAGHYALRGVMETASGFELNADSTFAFYFSYGALDRFASGRWRLEDSTVVLTTRPSPGPEFKLLSASAGSATNIVVQLRQMNKALLQYVSATLVGPKRRQEATADAAGRMVFAPQAVDSIEVHFEFCPEKTAVLPLPHGNRHFNIAPQPWLFEAFFANLRLTRTEEGLQGAHPFAEKTDFRYEKQR